MIAVAFQFEGPCAGCGDRNDDETRGGVIVNADTDDNGEDFDEADSGDADGDWLCLSCAREFAESIVDAVEKCETIEAAGFVYRGERWMPKAEHDAWLAKRKAAKMGGG